MLRQALLSVSRRTQQGLQECLHGEIWKEGSLRFLSSTATWAAKQKAAASAQPAAKQKAAAPAQPAAQQKAAASAQLVAQQRAAASVQPSAQQQAVSSAQPTVQLEAQPEAGGPIASAAVAAAASSQQQGLSAAPGITKVLGFAGVVPFLALSPFAATTLPLWFIDPALVTNSGILQVCYGAAVLSFLGGVHWGVAMTNIGGAVGVKLAQERYLWSVIPCLMAWPTLLMPITHAAGVQAALLGAVYTVDRSWAKRGLLPPWYMSLRGPLTLLAATGLVMTAALDVPAGISLGIVS